VRGGSGTQDLLPALSRKRKAQDRHLLGLSDITALHVFANQFWGWQTLHAPVLARIGSGRATKKESAELFELLNGTRSNITFEKLCPLNRAAGKTRKTFRGKVVGGNLCVLEALIGTPFQPQTRGRILFL
jgi:muramoyltetrapeptide carboxypeptidase